MPNLHEVGQSCWGWTGCRSRYSNLHHRLLMANCRLTTSADHATSLSLHQLSGHVRRDCLQVRLGAFFERSRRKHNAATAMYLNLGAEEQEVEYVFPNPPQPQSP